ncbi:MAG: LacI family transcriptional regulator [Clostridiales bacterium]|nr:LacI family transcriptional regulator [Clostridiales bacterium]
MRKVKTTEIARILGISKATVSLALNGKPGVSSQTRQDILALKARLEQDNDMTDMSAPLYRQGQGIIKVVVVLNGKNIVQNNIIDLWTPVLIRTQEKVKGMGYTLGLTYFNPSKDSLQDLEGECNESTVAGVLVIGTELDENQSDLFRGISKPMIVYDCDYCEDQAPCVIVNNYRGTMQLADYLVHRNLYDIFYLSTEVNIFNMAERRRGFLDGMQKYRIAGGKERIIPLSLSIAHAKKQFHLWLEKNPLPEAFIMESYHISIACLQVLQERNIRVPEDVSLIGVDEIPDYLLAEYPLTVLRVPDIERIDWCMRLLHDEICNPTWLKASVRLNCKLIERNSVKSPA